MKKTIFAIGLAGLTFLNSCGLENKVEEANTLNLQNREAVTEYVLSTYDGERVNQDSVWLSKPGMEADTPSDMQLNIKGKNNYSVMLENVVNYNWDKEQFEFSLKNAKPYKMDDGSTYSWRSITKEELPKINEYINSLKQ